MNPVHFSSASEDWATPQTLFDELNAEFGFTLDAAATLENTKCETFIDKNTDALKATWAPDTDGEPDTGAVWLNPPYGRKLGEWVAKAADVSKRQKRTVVCLLPARTDTKYWHAHIWDAQKHKPRKGVEVRFLKGRLKFGDSKNSAPFPSAVVIFK